MSYQQRTNLYRDAIERWHRTAAMFPALNHDETFPRAEDFGVEAREGERVQFEVEREFKRSDQ